MSRAARRRDLLGFFAALFVVINVMEHAMVRAGIGSGLERIIELGPTPGSALTPVSSAAAGSVTDNIPLAAMLAGIPRALGTDADSPLWGSVNFGANPGDNLTPTGSASTRVAGPILHRHRLTMSFAGLVRRAIRFASFQIVLTAACLRFFLR